MKKGIIISLIVVLLIVVAASSMYTVRENEYACVFRFGKIIDTADAAGLHFRIPFLDSVRYFSKATM